MQDDTTLLPATYGLEGGNGNPLDGRYRQPWWGMIKLGDSSLRASGYLAIAAVYRRRVHIGV